MTRNSTSKPRHSGGFTLLEVLVALVVLGFLVLALSEGARTGFSIWHAETKRAADTADIEAITRLLRQVLTRLPVAPASDRLLTNGTGAGMRGDRDRLSFVGELPSGLGGSRLADISLYVEKNTLILAWRPHRHAKPLAPPVAATQTALLSGVESVQFAYWGPASQGAVPAWYGKWDAAEAPDLIRVRLVFGSHDRLHWPDLIVAPRLQ